MSEIEQRLRAAMHAAVADEQPPGEPAAADQGPAQAAPRGDDHRLHGRGRGWRTRGVARRIGAAWRARARSAAGIHTRSASGAWHRAAVLQQADRGP